MNDQPPEYKVYRSRRNPLAGLRPSGDLDGLKRRLGRRREQTPRDDRRGITPGRVFKWIALAALGWILVSLLLFFVSAQLQDGISSESDSALASGGSLLTGSTVLVLGSDARTGDSIDESQTGPARSDTIMLVRAGFGSLNKLSIPRDSQADIPGHGTQKINAAYALGGPKLAIETVEGFLGDDVEINHLIEIDFQNFSKFIDAMGGVTIDVPRHVCSPPFDNFWKGLRFRKGEQKMRGRKALGYARIRKNDCAPNETDVDRARRQQELIAGIKGQLTSPGTFLRLPWVSWRGPRAIKSDLKGPGLLALALDAATGGTGDPNVLEPSCLSCGVGGSLVVSDGAKAAAVDQLMGR